MMLSALSWPLTRVMAVASLATSVTWSIDMVLSVAAAFSAVKLTVSPPVRRLIFSTSDVIWYLSNSWRATPYDSLRSMKSLDSTSGTEYPPAVLVPSLWTLTWMPLSRHHSTDLLLVWPRDVSIAALHHMPKR